MRIGLRYRLLIPTLILLGAVLTVGGYGARSAAERARAQAAEQLTGIAGTLGRGSFPLTPPILEYVKSLSGAELMLHSVDGELSGTLPTEAFRNSTAATAESAATAMSTAVEGLGAEEEIGGSAYYCRRVLLRDPHPQSGAVLYVLYPQARLRSAVDDAVRPTYFGLAAGLLVVVVMYFLGRRLAERIRVLRLGTVALSERRFEPIPLPRQDDELGDLTRAINASAERLQGLEAAVQAAERMRLSAQLSAGMAHQLRNGITGAKLALQLYRDDHPAVVDESLRVVARQLELLETNLRRFIDLNRGPAMRPTACDLNSLVRDVIELIGPQCRHAATTLHARGLDVRVAAFVDADQIRDLFWNVIGNAVEAAGPGGTVEVSAEPPTTTSTAEQNGGQVIYTIEDDGPGPPAKIADDLFEPFVTGKSEGIGLGLAVARRAVENHGGSIEWERTADPLQGRTRFRIKLPVDARPTNEKG